MEAVSFSELTNVLKYMLFWMAATLRPSFCKVVSNSGTLNFMKKIWPKFPVKV